MYCGRIKTVYINSKDNQVKTKIHLNILPKQIVPGFMRFHFMRFKEYSLYYIRNASTAI